MNETLKLIIKDLNNISDNIDYIIEEIKDAEGEDEISDACDYAISMIEASMYRFSCVRDKLRANF